MHKGEQNFVVCLPNQLKMSGCAVASDGSLLSPSKIDFYNDPDDITPISGPLLVAHGLTGRSASTGITSVAKLDNYFTSQQPAITLAGVRRTTRLSKPSARVRDAADSLNSSGTMSKRKANNISLQRRVARKVVPDPDDSDDKDTNGRSTLSTKTTDDTKEATECDSDADKVWAAYDQPRETVDEVDENREVSANLQISVICAE